MALVKCSECGKEISDKANTCPNCGCPLQKPITQSPPIPPQVAPQMTPPKKKKHGCLMAILIFIFVTFLIGTIANISTPSSNSKTSDTKNVDTTLDGGTESQPVKSEEETTIADNREAALDADKKIMELVQAAEADYNVLANMMASGTASDLDLYDVAKKVYSNLGTYQVNISRIECEGIKDYSDAASSYVINMQLTASYVKKYVDKQKMADLSSAKECINNMNNYVINLISKKMEFLKASGYTDEEVVNMLTEMGETTATPN